MHLERLKIDSFRNLRDFEIAFTRSALDADGVNCDLKSHAVIGQNGSGKSNMIEAIVTIFRDLDLNAPASLDYELDYVIRKHRMQIRASVGKVPEVLIDGGLQDAWKLSDMHREDPQTGKVERGHARLYLPSHIFTYYSGKNQRLEALFEQHQTLYTKNLSEFEEARDSDPLVRRLFYCRHPHSRLVLLACLLAPEKPLKDVLRALEIADVDSALFVLKKPYRLSGELSEEDVKTGDKRFWYDQSRFSQELLDKLWKLATARIDFTEDKTIDFPGRTEEQELLYLFLKDRETLTALKEHIGDSYRFFQYLEGSYIADLLDDLKVFVQHKTVNGLLSFEALSEGELQLLTVLGLMRITIEDHCLFLLDEPDTHLNPIWKLRYFDEIEKDLEQDEERTIKGDSQIIITTHDPMMIGSLRKEQVRILRNENGKVAVDTPAEHPQGMGIAGLLKSELFGLRSTVDPETLRRLDRRNFLYALGDGRTPAENQELSRLSDELADLGFASDFKDPYFAMFVKKMALHTKFHKESLIPEEQKEQDEIANAIIDEVLAEEADK